MNKPKMRYLREYELWECTNGLYAGHGHSPKEAYEDFLEWENICSPIGDLRDKNTSITRVKAKLISAKRQINVGDIVGLALVLGVFVAIGACRLWLR